MTDQSRISPGLIIDLVCKEAGIIDLALDQGKIGFALAITDRLVVDTRLLQDSLKEYLDSLEPEEK